MDQRATNLAAYQIVIDCDNEQRQYDLGHAGPLRD